MDSIRELFGHILILLVSIYSDIFADFQIFDCNAVEIVAGFVSIMLLFRSYEKYVAGVKPDTIDLNGKVYIVTGSNTGIGYETAKSLVEMGGTVVMACRSLDKAHEARDNIIRATQCSSTKIVVLQLDLCSFASVRKFAEDFKGLSMPLNCLINNAGLMMNDRETTKDGLEMVFTANHLSHFLLTNLLLAEITKTRGRVVILSSALHHIPKMFNFDDIMSEKNYSLFGTYSQSKLANILHAFELQRR